MYSPHFQIKSIHQLGSTPKGMDLGDHFGTKKEMNVYGPQGTHVNWAAAPAG